MPRWAPQRFSQRLFEKIEVRSEDECWPWLGARQRHGYGTIARRSVEGVRGTVLAHRAVYEACVGTIGDGLVVMHACDHPWCCNPGHLQTGHQWENVAAMVKRGRSASGARAGQAGERSHRAVLTRHQVREIRVRSRRGETQAALSRDFGVDQTTVSGIVLRKTWAWLDDEASS